MDRAGQLAKALHVIQRCAKAILAVICMAGIGGCGARPMNAAAHPGQHVQRLERTVTRTIRCQYLLYLPVDYTKDDRRWPLVLFLHGAGERGDDVERVKIHGPPKLAAGGKEFPFILVSPLCPKDEWWSPMVLNTLLDEVQAQYRVDERRIYVTGLSMGGFGTWALAIESPHRFAAIAPICGGGDARALFVGRIKHLPTWVFHGARDEVVPIEQSQRMVDALTTCGGNVKFTVYPEAGHDAWTQTYENPEFYGWLLAQQRAD